MADLSTCMAMGELGAMAVAMNGANKRFGTVIALSDVYLSLRSGLCHALSGPNGSGKSTLLRMLAGLTKADSGSVAVLGKSIETLRRTHAFGSDVIFVPQVFSLYGDLTVTENLKFQSALRAIRPADSAIAMSIADFELADYRNRRADQLSGGVRQRLTLAAALLQRPALLLLDEPTAALDAPSQERLWQHLQRVRAAGTTVVLTTHVAADLMRCDTVTQLAEGRVIAHLQRDLGSAP